MVPDLIWAHDFFGPQEIWATGKVVPTWKCYVTIFMQGPNPLELKLLRAQICWGPKKSGAQMRPGTISVIAIKCGYVIYGWLPSHSTRPYKTRPISWFKSQDFRPSCKIDSQQTYNIKKSKVVEKSQKRVILHKGSQFSWFKKQRV